MKKQNLALINKCTANITVKGNKLKKYADKVYLKDGQEFEIELQNYTTYVVAAKILMNGKPISSSMLVLKPGQRVVLNRFLDENKKFKFETYTVDSSIETQKAIEANGDIEIQFFKESVELDYKDIYNGPLYSYNVGMMRTNSGRRISSPTYSSGMGSTCTTSSFTNKSISFMSDSLSNCQLISDNIETGRIEKGSTSDQKFRNYTGNFEPLFFMSISIKLLPYQYKPLSAVDLAEYCVNCGTKNKKGNYKFCPKCGTKF